MSYENNFVEKVLENSITDSIDVLKLYRNMYYNEPVCSEHRIVAEAINDLILKYKETILHNK